MPNILILGATGYIGSAVASSLVRSGSHTIYGLARTPQKASQLATQEIHPVLGSVDDSAAYLSLVRSVPIDVVIDASGAMAAGSKILSDLRTVAKERLDQAAAAGIKVSKLGFVYTSGIWVHGSSPHPVTDLTPVGVAHAPSQPPKIVAWRPKLEQEIIGAPELDAVVIRPGLVYGRAGALWDAFLGPIAQAMKVGEKVLELKAETEGRPALIHVDDVATGIHAAVDKLPLLAGTGVYPVFDLVTSQESMREIFEAAARSLGYKGEVKLVGAGEDLFMQALSTTINASGSRAQELLGWKPRRIGFVKEMETFVKAWAAGQGQS